MFILDRMLENGLLVKGAQAQAVQRLRGNNWSEVAAEVINTKGNQKRYHRLTPEGRTRAQGITKLWKKAARNTMNAEGTADYLRAKASHRAQHDLEVITTLRHDIRRCLRQGATRATRPEMLKTGVT